VGGAGPVDAAPGYIGFSAHHHLAELVAQTALDTTDEGRLGNRHADACSEDAEIWIGLVRLTPGAANDAANVHAAPIISRIGRRSSRIGWRS
jgi:hypothetical protein